MNMMSYPNYNRYICRLVEALEGAEIIPATGKKT